MAETEHSPPVPAHTRTEETRAVAALVNPIKVDSSK